MITLRKICHSKKPEDLKQFGGEYLYVIDGAKKLDNLCTVLALTQDLKHVLNTDPCDYYQPERFNKQDMLDIIEDLVELTDKMRG